MAHSENCRHLLASLSDYIDGTLQEELCQDLEQHMGGCENCRIVVDTLRKTVSLYHISEETGQMPQGVRERLFMRLNLDEYLR